MAFCEFDVKVVPRSSQSRIEIQPDGTLKVWVHGAPVEGQANAAVISLLAAKMSVPKSSVSILRGQTGRLKRIRVEGIELKSAIERLS